MPSGKCPKCGEYFTNLSRHHHYPRRFFSTTKKEKKTNTKITLLCRDDHNKLEMLIPTKERKSKQWYDSIVEIFIRSPL